MLWYKTHLYTAPRDLHPALLGIDQLSREKGHSSLLVRVGSYPATILAIWPQELFLSVQDLCFAIEHEQLWSYALDDTDTSLTGNWPLIDLSYETPVLTSQPSCCWQARNCDQHLWLRRNWSTNQEVCPWPLWESSTWSGLVEVSWSSLASISYPSLLHTRHQPVTDHHTWSTIANLPLFSTFYQFRTAMVCSWPEQVLSLPSLQLRSGWD